MNITPVSHGGAASSSCGNTSIKTPPGYLVCVHGFSIFTSGAAGDLQDCLALIGVQDQCTDEKWQACIDAMYANVCASQDIVNTCADIANACGADPLDKAQCADDLNPFSNEGLQQFQDCFNANPNDPGRVYDFLRSRGPHRRLSEARSPRAVECRATRDRPRLRGSPNTPSASASPAPASAPVASPPCAAAARPIFFPWPKFLR